MAAKTTAAVIRMTREEVVIMVLCLFEEAVAIAVADKDGDASVSCIERGVKGLFHVLKEV